MSDGVWVRVATIQDVDALANLRAEMFAAMGVSASATSPTTEGSHEWVDQARQWFAARINNPDYGFFVAEVDDEVVACAIGAIRDAAPSPSVPQGRDVLISNVCTLPTARGRGYGTLVFNAVMEWARSTGIRRAELMATDDGRAMYERVEFQPTAQPAMRVDL